VAIRNTSKCCLMMATKATATPAASNPLERAGQ
jgi:hypothetical protein